jgi:hypothetical protein
MSILVSSAYRPNARLRRARAGAMIAPLKRAAFAALPMSLRWRYIHRRNRRTPMLAETSCGRGSTLVNTENIRRELPALLRRHGIKSVVDVPCGDFHWMRCVLPACGIERYVGLDIVPELIAENRKRYRDDGIEFGILDVIRRAPPEADLVLMRDLLIHFSFSDAASAMLNVRRSGATWLLTTTYTEIQENRDIVTGRWRPINLELAPYRMPPPLELIREHELGGKSLGLWRLS